MADQAPDGDKLAMLKKPIERELIGRGLDHPPRNTPFRVESREVGLTLRKQAQQLWIARLLQAHKQMLRRSHHGQRLIQGNACHQGLTRIRNHRYRMANIRNGPKAVAAEGVANVAFPHRIQHRLLAQGGPGTAILGGNVSRRGEGEDRVFGPPHTDQGGASFLRGERSASLLERIVAEAGVEHVLPRLGRPADAREGVALDVRELQAEPRLAPGPGIELLPETGAELAK